MGRPDAQRENMRRASRCPPAQQRGRDFNLINRGLITSSRRDPRHVGETALIIEEQTSIVRVAVKIEHAENRPQSDRTSRLD